MGIENRGNIVNRCPETKNIKVAFTKNVQDLVEKEVHRTGKTFSSIVRECILKSIKN